MDFFPDSPVAAAAKAVSQQKCVFGRLDGILLFSVRFCATVLCVTYMCAVRICIYTPKTRGRGILPLRRRVVYCCTSRIRMCIIHVVYVRVEKVKTERGSKPFIVFFFLRVLLLFLANLVATGWK